MCSKLEPAIWSHDTGQQIPCFDKCQLNMAWKSNIKERDYKLRLHMCQPFSWYGCHLVRLRHRLYVPTSNTASHDNHEKINSWVSIFPI